MIARSWAGVYAREEIWAVLFWSDEGRKGGGMGKNKQKAPVVINDIAGEIARLGGVLRFIDGAGENNDCSYESLNAFMDSTRLLIQDGIESIDRILTDLIKHYPDLK